MFCEPAQLADQSRRMPRRAGGQLFALKQNDISPAELGQMIGDGTAGDAATNDDGPCLGRNNQAVLTPLLERFSGLTESYGIPVWLVL